MRTEGCSKIPLRATGGGNRWGTGGPLGTGAPRMSYVWGRESPPAPCQRGAVGEAERDALLRRVVFPRRLRER